MSMGNFLCTFSDPIEVYESNEVEVYAMLVGRRNLRTFGSYNAIIEGDSFFAIKLGAGKASYPWRLANWVEEVRYISSQLSYIFIHVIRGANEATNMLAREGSAL